MADDDSPAEDSDIFSGLRFLLSGFDPQTHEQLSAAVERNGGVNLEEYDDSCTHVVVSRTLVWDDPVCEIARNNGKFLVTEIWISDCMELGVIADANHVVYRPPRSHEGIPGSKDLVVCLTGYQTHFRKNVMRMVYLMGAKFSKPLVAISVTHLVCYKFEGDKFTLAKNLGLKLINHQWLEDCLKSWSILPVEKYTKKSGEEVELLEAKAEDSEDDGSIGVKASSEHCSSHVAPESGKQESARASRVAVNGIISPSSLQISNSRCLEIPAHNLISNPPAEKNEVETSVTKYGYTDDKNDRTETMRRHSVSRIEEALVEVNHGYVERTNVDTMHHGKASEESPKSVQTYGARKSETVAPLKATGTIYNSSVTIYNAHPKDYSHSPTTSPVELQNSKICFPGKENMLANEHTDGKGDQDEFSVKDINAQLTPCCNTDLSKETTGHILIEEKNETLSSPSFLHKDISRNDSDVLENKEVSVRQSKSKSMKKRKSLTDCTMETNAGNHVQCTETSISKYTGTKINIPGDMHVQLTGKAMAAGEHETASTPPLINQVNLLEQSDVMKNGAGYVTSADRSLSTGRRASKSRRPNIMREDDKNHLACMKTTPLSMAKLDSTIHASATKNNSSRDVQVDYSSVVTSGNTKRKQKAGSQEDCKDGEPRNSSPSEKVIPFNATSAQTNGHNTPMGSVETGRNVENVHDTALEDCKEGIDENEVRTNCRKYDGQKHDSDMLVEPVGSVPRLSKKRTTDQMNPQKQAESDSHDREETVKIRMLKNGRRKIDSQDNSAAPKKQVKGRKVITSKKRDLKGHSSVYASLDKENAVTLQGHEQKFVSKIPKTGSVLKDSGKIVRSPSKSMLPNTGGQTCFALSGRKQEIKPLQALVKRLGGKLCKDSHEWSHQTTHLVTAGQLRRTEKFFAAAAAGRWILRGAFLKDSADAGMFLDEKKYEWYGSGMTEDGSICLEAPRKWREHREKSGFCALEGLRIVLYGECIIPSLDTLKRAIRAGGAELLATSPPYTRSLVSGVDVAIVSPGTPRTDPWVQEFLNHNLACVTPDFFVSFVCTPNSPLDRHVLYDSLSAVDKIVAHLKSNRRAARSQSDADDGDVDETRCSVCGSIDREDVMLLCGDTNGNGCGIAMHIDCCNPPLAEVPANDWFCSQCTKPQLPRQKKKPKRKAA